jgi:hypothetical protein
MADILSIHREIPEITRPGFLEKLYSVGRAFKNPRGRWSRKEDGINGSNGIRFAIAILKNRHLPTTLIQINLNRQT